MSIQIYAPATVANLACGFDVLGLAVNEPYDLVEVREIEARQVRFVNQTAYPLPPDAEANVLTFCVLRLLKHLDCKRGFELRLLQKIKPGSGLGSSAASAVAGIFGVNELLGQPLSRRELLPFALEGEKLACGNAHADNISPALLGGITLVRAQHPLDVVSILHPDLYCGLIHPQIEVKTADARRVLPQQVALEVAIRQWANVAGLVAGFITADYALLARSMVDVIVEPRRSALIPCYQELKRKALEFEILGCSIAGSGPSLMVLSSKRAPARAALESMKAILEGQHIASLIYLSKIRKHGVEVANGFEPS